MRTNRKSILKSRCSAFIIERVEDGTMSINKTGMNSRRG